MSLAPPTLPPAGPAPDRLGWRAYVLLALVALAFFLPGQARLPPVDRDESRYAQAASQMLESGNFVDVRFQDKPRYLQPVGIYWLQALSVSQFSSPQARRIWAYRVPSLIAATAAVVLTAWIGSMMFGAEAGVAAALLMAMCALLAFEARQAKIDATLLAVTLAAQGALARAYLGRIRTGRPNAVLFWTALGVGLLLKGPIILIVSGTTALALCLADRRVAWLKRLHAGWGAPLALAVALPWFVAIGLETHGAFFAKAVGQNLLGKVARGEQAHGSPPGYYLAMATLTFWPGSLAAALAVPWTWRSRGLPQVRFLLAWTLPTWLIYELIATKLPHYALPYFPALACLAAAAALAPDGWRAGRLGRAAAWAYSLLWLVVAGVIAVAGAVGVQRSQGHVDALSATLALVVVALSLATLWLVRRGDRRQALACVGAAAWIAGVGLFGYSLPAARRLWLAPRIVAAVDRVRPCPDSWVASSAYSEPSLVFLSRGRAYLDDVGRTADWLSRNRACGLALVGTRQLPAFQARASADRLPLTALATLQGPDYSRARALELILFRATPPPGR